MNAGHAAKTEADRLALKARIKAALANDVGLKTLSNLTVDLDDSTAILTGTVATAADKDRAYQTALSVPGVSRVVNNVRVE
jgi:osmotically-inducible protein OsmY